MTRSGLTQPDRGADCVQRREFISVMNDFNRPPAALAKTSDLVQRQGGMATIDMTDYIGSASSTDVGIN